MLKGERVLLRPLREEDFDAWYRAGGENVQIALLAGGDWLPYTETAARRRWEWMLTSSADERINFAIEANGAYIGHIALRDIDRRSQHAWLAISLDAEHVGQGYGRDAVRVLLRWAFAIQNFHRISLETWGSNERAIRSYRAVGFVDEGRLRQAKWVDGCWEDVVQMGLLRDEWKDEG